MPEKPPANPIFDEAPGRSHGTTLDKDDWFGLPADDRERRLLRDLRQRLKDRPVTHNGVVFRPELLVRTYPGDHGVRPYGGVFWESPDIWLAAGDPATTPAVPPAPGGTVVAGAPNTLYAHVWNLGLAPIIGVSVEFLVFNPSLGFAGQTPLFSEVVRVDLAGRSNPAECHKLVKCPTAWVPTFVNEGHECVIVRVSGVGDPLGSNPYEPAHNRHVGQRNVLVAPFGEANMPELLKKLQETLPEAQLEYWQAGQDAAAVVKLVAPKFQLHPQVEARRIGSPYRTLIPGPGQATVARIHAVGPNATLMGGYTVVWTGKEEG